VKRVAPVSPGRISRGRQSTRLKSEPIHSDLLLRCEGQFGVEVPVAQMSNDILRVVSAKPRADKRQDGRVYLHHFVHRWIYSRRLLDVIITPGLPLRLFGDVRVLA
jgi:hypothetical protein